MQILKKKKCNSNERIILLKIIKTIPKAKKEVQGQKMESGIKNKN